MAVPDRGNVAPWGKVKEATNAAPRICLIYGGLDGT